MAGGSRIVGVWFPRAMDADHQRSRGSRRWRQALAGEGEVSSWVHVAFLGLVALSVFFVSGPWAGFHGVLLGLVGLLMLWRPPVAVLPRTWWLLAAGFVVSGGAAFLPAAWFGVPEWRSQLAALGVPTGELVVIQSRQAVELLALFALMLLTGLWLAGHRASSETLRRCALAFTLAVAVYAVVSRLSQVSPMFGGGETGNPKFGFFPNRNHSATYLAMGAVCGLGTILQFGRDKRFVMLAIAIAATAVILWATAAWSISRAGVVLTAAGLLVWLSLLGRRYLGRHGLWAVALILIATGGFFLIADTEVKQRLTDTVEKAGSVVDPTASPSPDGGKSALDSTQHLDFRIPVFLDTLDMIARYPLTGIGAGQFYYVFPQYRNRTIVAQDADAYHPESDWLWLAAELGLPAALALLALIVLAVVAALRGVLAGRDRALRSACLVAAVLVPLHGGFDVPGHRISLAWAAALLFSLSLHPTSSQVSPRRWWFRFGVPLLPLLAAAFLIHAQWLGGRPPATTAAQIAIQQAQTLYQEDLALQKAAETKGIPYQPKPEDDKLEKALRLLDAAKPIAPLDRNLPRHEGFLAFHFDDKQDRIDKAFAIDRALDPKWVVGPLRQAETWAHVDPSHSVPLLNDALKRSRVVEQLDPQNRRNSAKTRELIRQLANRYPGLKEAMAGLENNGAQE